MPKPKQKKSSERPDKTANRSHARRDIRETVESIAIAFILAFLFRTFEAEAFVIPTGSMAPTLQGRHKDVECPQCEFRYQSSASEEESGAIIAAATCPMCRYQMTVDPALELGPPDPAGPRELQPTYNGDRILVGKFIYEFSEPERWDVIVFKYPGDAKMNYIKRLVGLPGEEILVQGGDVYTRPNAPPAEGQPAAEVPFEIARKPPFKVQAMLQLVHDNDYLPAEYSLKNWPLRWHVWPPSIAPADGGWKEERKVVSAAGRELVRQDFSISGKSSDAHWLRYQHFVPSLVDWEAMRRGPLPPDHPIRPQLINDFYAYNTSLNRNELRAMHEMHLAPKFGLHWVGDLMLDVNVRVTSDQGEVLLDLVEGGRHLQCAIDVANGQAKLSIDGHPDFAPTARTEVRGPGAYHLQFSNIDDELLLWINGELVKFDGPTTYPSPGILKPVSTLEDAGDLAPAGLGSRGAAMQVEGLRVLRDIYYIADEPPPFGTRDHITDYQDPFAPMSGPTRRGVANLLSQPERWDVFEQRRGVRFLMEADQFFVMGDNSPFSKDSRLWSSDPDPLTGLPMKPYVSRELLIGKALFVYWPHSWDRLPGTRIPFPFFPNVSDMGLVR